MKTYEEMFALIRRIASIESQLVTGRSYPGEPDGGDGRSYQGLQERRRELDASHGYGPARSGAA